MFGRKNIKRPRKTGTQSHRLSTLGTSLIVIVLFLTLFGLLMVFSSSAVIAYTKNGDVFYFFKLQIIWVILGVIAAAFIYFSPLRRIKLIGIVALVSSLILMLYMLPEALFNSEIPFVNTKNGATRWIDLGFSDLQPSEIVKIGLIIFLCVWLTMSLKRHKSIENYVDRFKDRELVHFVLKIVSLTAPFLIFCLIVVLIIIQKDLDTIVIIAVTFFAISYVGTSDKKSSLVILFTFFVFCIGGVFALFGEGYRRERVTSFAQILINGEPSTEYKLGSGFQVWNGLVAIGSGGFFGVGYNESRQKLFFLQEASYTDSIFAIIGEEFGVMGSLLVIIGFLVFLSTGIQIAKNSKDKFSGLLAFGITFWIVIQAFLNIAANLAVIPFGGMPLPFFTYGGSTTIMSFIGVGILLNISKQSALKDSINLKRVSRVATLS